MVLKREYPEVFNDAKMRIEVTWLQEREKWQKGVFFCPIAPTA